MLKKITAICLLLCICIGLVACGNGGATEPTETIEETLPPMVLQEKEYTTYSIESQGIIVNFCFKLDSKYTAVTTKVDEFIEAIDINEGDKTLMSGGTWHGIALEKKDELLSYMLEGATEAEVMEAENVIFTFYELPEGSNSRYVILIKFKLNDAFVVLESPLELDEIKTALNDIHIE